MAGDKGDGGDHGWSDFWWSASGGPLSHFRIGARSAADLPIAGKLTLEVLWRARAGRVSSHSKLRGRRRPAAESRPAKYDLYHPRPPAVAISVG